MTIYHTGKVGAKIARILIIAGIYQISPGAARRIVADASLIIIFEWRIDTMPDMISEIVQTSDSARYGTAGLKRPT